MKRLRVSLIALTTWLLLFGYASAQDQPIKLGVQFIMSGKLGGYGKNGERAILMAMDEINAAGGILGRKVEALFADTQLKSDVAVKNAGKFVLEDKVDFMVGPTSSAVATALIDLAEKYKKILVLTQAASEEMTSSKFSPYVFSTLSNAMMHSRAGAYVMATTPVKRWMCEQGKGSGLASCLLPFSLDNPAHRRIVESDMRCNFRLGITMLQMSLGDCQVPFRYRSHFRQETIKRRPRGKRGHSSFLLLFAGFPSDFHVNMVICQEPHELDRRDLPPRFELRQRAAGCVSRG